MDRDKKVLVAKNTVFVVGDHDFTKAKLIPSIYLLADIPESATASFFRGTIKVCLKEAAFQPSSPLRHAAELSVSLNWLGCSSEANTGNPGRWWTRSQNTVLEDSNFYKMPVPEAGFGLYCSCSMCSIPKLQKLGGEGNKHHQLGSTICWSDETTNGREVCKNDEQYELTSRHQGMC